MPTPLSEAKGGHAYKRRPGTGGTSDCEFCCGCWVSGFDSGHPKGTAGIDPFGKCPKNPRNRKGEGEVKVITAKSLIGKKLDGFSLQEYTEVYKTDVEGRGKEASLGHFKDNNIANAFAGKQTDAAWHKTQKVLLLTDGKVGFVVGESVKLLDDEKAALEMRQAILAKLSPAEREILGL